jgi:glyoxylase-like metal-dependent hydrolase (beta-lactamase superfamily II)
MSDPLPPVPGAPVALFPGLVRLTAPNPSPMTFTGTTSYILGDSRPLVIDPGPDDPRHLEALLTALAGRRPEAIVVTHAHRDHSALAPALRQATGAPVLAFGPAGAGQSAVMRDLAKRGLSAAGEGADAGFVPDVTLADGDTLAFDGGRITALHTPGHFGNHLCLAWGESLFTGDHVMGWSTSIVVPPEGDMADYRASLRRLSQGRWTTALPGHGAPIPDPAARIAELIAHRAAREAAILTALAAGPADLMTLTRRAYADLAPALLPMAAQNALAHLIELAGQGRVSAPGLPAPGTVFALA